MKNTNSSKAKIQAIKAYCTDIMYIINQKNPTSTDVNISWTEIVAKFTGPGKRDRNPRKSNYKIKSGKGWRVPGIEMRRE